MTLSKSGILLGRVFFYELVEILAMSFVEEFMDFPAFYLRLDPDAVPSLVLEIFEKV